MLYVRWLAHGERLREGNKVDPDEKKETDGMQWGGVQY